MSKPKARSSANRLILGAACSIGVILLFLVVTNWLLLWKPFNIPSGGMTPTVDPGDQVVMEGVSFRFREPRRGEIAVFETRGIEEILLPHGQDSVFFIKRLVGLPGDELQLVDQRLFVNGDVLYATDDIDYQNYGLLHQDRSYTVPAGHYFMLGDNGSNSFDSRHFGPVPAKNLTGRLWFRYWPPSRIGAPR